MRVLFFLAKYLIFDDAVCKVSTLSAFKFQSKHNNKQQT